MIDESCKEISLFKNLSLSAYYFKNNFKIIKLVCKKNGNDFRLQE